jgi:hypothetical protein
MSTIGPTRPSTLPDDAQGRKQRPVVSGVLRYFPDAIVALAEVSWAGNEQHHPGEPLHWDRDKSADEEDALGRHLMCAGTLDVDGKRHTAKVAWRALAMLQKEIEAERAVAAAPSVDRNYPELRAEHEEVECLWDDAKESYLYIRDGVPCCNKEIMTILCTLPADHTGRTARPISNSAITCGSGTNADPRIRVSPMSLHGGADRVHPRPQLSDLSPLRGGSERGSRDGENDQPVQFRPEGEWVVQAGDLPSATEGERLMTDPKVLAQIMKHLERFVLEWAGNSTGIAASETFESFLETQKQEKDAIEWAKQALDFYFHA